MILTLVKPKQFCACGRWGGGGTKERGWVNREQSYPLPEPVTQATRINGVNIFSSDCLESKNENTVHKHF